MFNAGATTSNNNTLFLIRARDVLWLRQSLTAALFPLTIEENWVADNQTELNTARDYGNELFESLEACFMPARTGEIALFAGVLPSGVLACDGATFPPASYPALYAVIGVTFGVGVDGAFKLPDLRGRIPIGTGQAVGLTNRMLATNYGVETVQLTVSEIPSHTHAVLARANGTIGASSRALLGAGGTVTDTSPTGPAGSGSPHSNIQPSLGLNYGIFT